MRFEIWIRKEVEKNNNFTYHSVILSFRAFRMRTHTHPHTPFWIIQLDVSRSWKEHRVLRVFVMLYKPTWHRERGKRVTWKDQEMDKEKDREKGSGEKGLIWEHSDGTSIRKRKWVSCLVEQTGTCTPGTEWSCQLGRDVAAQSCWHPRAWRPITQAN